MAPNNNTKHSSHGVGTPLVSPHNERCLATTSSSSPSSSLNDITLPDLNPQQTSKNNSKDNSYKPGDKVDVYWANFGRYFSGTLSSVLDDAVFIRYDDGDSEWLHHNSNKNIRPSLLHCRVDILWDDDDDEYHAGTITKVNGEQDWHYVEYDDGENIAWVDLKDTVFRVLQRPADVPTTSSTSKKTKKKKKKKKSPTTDEVQQQQHKKKKRRVSVVEPKTTESPPLSVGSRVGIWWEEDEKYYNGRIAQIKGNSHHVCYDDGEEEWLDLTKEKYILRVQDDDGDETKNNEDDGDDDEHTLVECFDLDAIQIGTRVAVWWNDQARYYAATVLQLGMILNDSKTKLFQLQYEGPPGKVEWLCLEAERFRLVLASPNKKKKKKPSSRRRNTISI